MSTLDSQASELVKNNRLVQLVQADNFIGWCYRMTYDRAHIMVNDLLKAEVLGVPHNCFVVATPFDPEAFNKATQDEQEVILLRVIGASKLPQDDDLVGAKIDYYQKHRAPIDQERDYDEMTLRKMQFHGLECRILGTFFMRENKLWMGSDIESFSSATRLNVYRPRGEALETIVNYVDPIRRQDARETAEELGIDEPDPFRIGSVRYTSTDRLHRGSGEPSVPVYIQPSDFLARRTAVLGMTRTGKSNMIKQLVSVVKRVSDDSGVNIGQIIYDLNGEYANVNQIEEGALADVYPEDEVVRYSMTSAEGFEELRTNFYEQLTEGFSIIQRELAEAGLDRQNYQREFVNQSFEEPDERDRSAHNRWERRVAAYRALLYRARFSPPEGYRIRFSANANVREAVNRRLDGDPINPSDGISLEQAAQWFAALQEANQEENLTSSSSDRMWVSDDLQNLLNMITQSREGGAFLSGHQILADVRKFHAPRRTSDVNEEIYSHLTDGRIVILDLSLANPTLRGKISEDIARTIFRNSMQHFVDGDRPPNIVVYTEESHNLIGKDLELDETWPRLAKEGAKYNIAMVYATQEVSSVHPNILANTENWFITHLNNEREIKELSRFYDFDDFSRSLIRAQDVGFARVKTLSGPFVIPTQIDKFDPAAEKQRMQQLQESKAVPIDTPSDGATR